MQLSQFVSQDRFISPLVAKDKVEALEHLAAKLCQTETRLPRHRYLAELLRREAICGTGIGKGVALPHMRNPWAGKITLTLGIAPQGVEYNSFDKEPVKILILLCAPASQSTQYLKVMARLSQFLRSPEIRDSLIQAHNFSEILQIFAGEITDIKENHDTKST